MSTTIIADNPPSDGQQWDCQCARCGSSCYYVDCEHCGFEDFPGYVNRYEEDPLWYDEDDLWPCDVCQGQGAWAVCLSDCQWCELNPLEGREDVERGKIEWFVIKRRSA